MAKSRNKKRERMDKKDGAQNRQTVILEQESLTEEEINHSTEGNLLKEEEKTDVVSEKCMQKKAKEKNIPLSKHEPSKIIKNRKEIVGRRRMAELFLNGRNNWFEFIPIMFLLAIVPTVVFLKVIPLSSNVAANWSSNPATDFFSYYKSVLLMVVVVCTLFVLFFCYKKEERKKTTKLKVFYILLGIYTLFTTLSAITSRYSEIAYFGAPDRREGLVVLLCYVIMCVFTILSYKREKNYKYVFWPLVFLMTVSFCLGLSQFFGHDFLQTEFGKTLLLPSEYKEQAKNMSFQFERGKIYGTMFHYNYIGSFGALVAPFFITIALFVKDKKYKIVSVCMSVCALFVLFGSTSRAGVVGMALAVIFFLLVFFRQLLLHYKTTLAGIAVLAVLLAIFSVATKGEIFQRVPTLLQDIKSINRDKNFDYHDHVPVKKIDIDGKRVTFTLQNETLTLDYTTGKVHFFDTQDEYVEFQEQTEGQFVTADVRFSDFSYMQGTIKKTENGKEQTSAVLAISYRGMQVFFLDLSKMPIVFLNNSLYPIDLVDAPYIGFEGKEKIGSMRGYIWSRSLPLLKNTKVVGYGPDTFLMTFPQGDILAKWYAYDTTNMIVDKAHNWYLQVGLNQGMIALIALLAMMLLYIIDSMSLYAFQKQYTMTDTFGVGTFLGVIGYIGAGFFNDSVVSVAPIFWCMLGMGVGANYWSRILREVETEREISHMQV